MAPAPGSTAAPPAAGSTVAPPAGGTPSVPLVPLNPPPPAAPALPVQIPGALAAGGPILVTESIDRTVIRVGDLVHYSMTISAPPGSKIAMPPPGAQLGEFLIRDYRFPGMEEPEIKWSDSPIAYVKRKLGLGAAKLKGQSGQEFNFTITAYDTGDLVIPPLPLMVVDARGEKHALFAESARVRVAPVTSPEDLTIKDVHPPQRNPVPTRTWLPYVLAPVLLIAAILAALWFIRRRKREEIELKPQLPAHELAFNELSALEQEGLLEAGAYEKYYTRLSWILRKYLALRFGIYALEFTTGEILLHLKTADLEHADYERVRRFLESADQVKFARREPALEERTSVLAEARELVTRTKKEPLPLEAAKEAA